MGMFLCVVWCLNASSEHTAGPGVNRVYINYGCQHGAAAMGLVRHPLRSQHESGYGTHSGMEKVFEVR